MLSNYFAASLKTVVKVVSQSFITLICLTVILVCFASPAYGQCQPPEPPTLRATPGSAHGQITLSWNHTSSLPGYTIYMSRTGVTGSFVELYSRNPPTVPNAVTETIDALDTNKTYYFYVAVAGCSQAVLSNIASATTFDIDAPVLTAIAGSDFGQMTLSWNIPQGANLGYTIYMSTTGLDGSFVQISSGSIPSGTTTFTKVINGLDTNKTYYFYVPAVRGTRQRNSNIASATTFDIDAPVLTATQSENNQVTLTWNTVAGANPYYGVYTFSTAQNNWNLINSYSAQNGANTISVTFGNLGNNQVYYYKVRVARGSRQRDSNVVSVIVKKDQDAGEASCNARRGDPVNVTNGNMYVQQTDYNLPGLGENINITRTYNSIIQTSGLFGKGWSTQYDENIASTDNYSLRLSLTDGRAVYFGRTDLSAPFAPVTAGFYGQIVKNADNSYTLTYKDGSIHQFNNTGKLLSLRNRQNNQTTLNYDGLGKLTRVTDAFGRTLNVALNSNGLVEQISDGLGIIATYEYGTSGELKAVNYPDGSKYKFTYITRSISGVNNLLLTEVRDALDNTLEKHEYDSAGRATTSERHGGVQKFIFDYSNSAYTQVTDALNRTSKHYYDRSRGRAVVTKVEGNCDCGTGPQTALFEYDSKLNLTKKTDALNNVTTYTYDTNGNQLTETSVLGTETYTYNSFGQVLTRKDRMNGVTTNTYDAQGNLLTSKDPLNKTTTFTYTTIGQLQTVKDARNNTTTLTYDNFGRLTEIKDADNKTTIYGYDARARVTSTTNALSQTTAYEYDSRNRLKKITYPDTKFVTYNYDLAGRRTSMVDARNNTTVYGYDNAYRLTSVTDPLNHTTTFGYDLMSNRTSVTDALNNTTSYEYDNFDRLKKIVYPAATTGATRLEEQMEYDTVGNVKKRIDTANRPTEYEYDAANRMIKITDPNLNSTQFEYNNRSQMTKVTDALNQAYDFTYDPLGRVLTQIRAGVTTTFEYDAVGNRAKRTDYKGVVTSYSYDNMNRLQSIIYPNASENVSLTYDALSQLKTATNQNGTITFAYDNRNRVSNVTDVWNKTVAYDYDANGNRDLLKLDGVNYAAYAYDLANRLTGITAADDNTQITFGYDNANKLTNRNYPNGVSTAFEYDNMSRLKRLTDTSATATLFDRQHSYNTASQISQIVEPAKTRTFGYDNLDRLTNVTPSVGTNETYAFDAVGNRTASHLSSAYTHQPFNRLTATVGATFGYDNNGNMTSKTDAAGTWTYEWDYENRLKKATKPNGDYVVYKYDALGRRIERSLNSGAFTRFTYDGQDVLVDNDSALGTVKYLNGLGIDNKLRQVVNGQAQYFLADHLGSTNGLVDGSGGVVAQTGYDAFGNQTAALPTRYGYTGRERDDFTGFYHYRARQYSPDLGRFISEDPIGFEGGDINLFVYVYNNPTNLIDPSGNVPLPLITAGIGGAAGGLGTIIGKELENYWCGRNLFHGADKWEGYWDDVAIGIGGGVVTGALMGTPLGGSMAGAMMIGAGGNMGQYWYSSAYHNRDTSAQGYFFAGATGALGGLAGGKTTFFRPQTPMRNIRNPIDRKLLQDGFNEAADKAARRKATEWQSYGRAFGGGFFGNALPGSNSKMCDCN